MNNLKNAQQFSTNQDTVNENKTRVIAFFTLLIVIAYFISGYLFLPCFLLGDFLLRATQQDKNSLLGLLADFVVSKFNLQNKPADKTAKRFAATIELAFLVIILTTVVLHLTLISSILSVLLILIVFLESVVGFSLGSFVYNTFKSLKPAANK